MRKRYELLSQRVQQANVEENWDKQDDSADCVCPSICPSDWDKRNLLVASDFSIRACDERIFKKRRGQDSNLRTSYPVTGLANPRFRPLSHLSELLRADRPRTDFQSCPRF